MPRHFDIFFRLNHGLILAQLDFQGNPAYNIGIEFLSGYSAASAIGGPAFGGGYKKSMHFVYFLQSLKNKKFYVGVTHKDPNERTKEHNTGANSWSKQNGPLKLVYFEGYYCKQDAYYREKFYKSGFGRKIRNIILKTLNYGL